MKRSYDYSGWYYIVKPIIEDEEFILRKTYKHHGEKSVYDHSVAVSKYSYRIAKFLGADFKSAAIAGILHDFYETPWQDVVIKQPIYKMHAFTHARSALKNSKNHYEEYLNPKIENAILRHMFPLNLIPPKYATGFIVTFADKIASIDFILSPKSLYKTFFFFRKD